MDKNRIFLASLVLSLFFASLIGTATAAVPTLLSLQGKVTNYTTGEPISSGDIKVEIYNVATAGSPIFQETHSSAIQSDGIFDVLVGSLSNLEMELNQEYYLEVYVDNSEVIGDGVSSGRRKFTASGGEIDGSDIKAGTIDDTKVSFNYADSTSKGGPATDVSCTNCISDSEVSDSISINNGRLYAPTGSGNIGIGTTSPGSNKLKVAGNVDTTGFTESGSNTLSNDISGTAATASDVSCTNCIGGREIDESSLSGTASSLTVGDVSCTNCLTTTEVASSDYATSCGNADTVDNYHAGNAANRVPVLDSSGKYVGIPKRDINGVVQYKTAELGSSDREVGTTATSYECAHKTITVDLTGVDFIKVDYELREGSSSTKTHYVKLMYNTVDYAPWSGSLGTSYAWKSAYADVRSLTGDIQFQFCYYPSGGSPIMYNRGLNVHANDFEDV